MKTLAIILLFTALSVQVRKDFTADFNNAVNGVNGMLSSGFSVGNGPDGERTFWQYNGNIDLSCLLLELNNADVKLNGTIIYFNQEVSIAEMIELERIIKKLETDSITYL